MSPRNLGWGVSLRYHGRTVADRRLHGEVVVGEDPACAFVVPGLGPAAVVARGDTLLGAPDRAGSVTRDGVPAPFAGPCTLGPGDRAELELGDGITLELRREDYPRLPFATFFNPRELARQLVVGAAAVATIALLVRIETPANALEVRGDPDADSDSPLIRAMFAVTPVVLPPTDLYTFVVPPPPPIAPEPAPAPVEAHGVGTLALPDIDAPAKKPRKRRPELAMLGSGSGDGDVFAVLSADVEAGAVLGGVVGGVVADDVLARESDSGRKLAPILGGGGSYDPSVLDAELVEEVVELKEVEAVVERNEIPPPPQRVISVATGQAGDDPHAVDGADAVHGVVSGLVAVAPTDRCDDPTLIRKPNLDVVFVVDVSTTMTFMLDRIEKQIAQVDAEARAQRLDPRYGLVVFVDDVLVANNGQPFADLAALQQDLARWQAFTAGNRQIHSEAQNLDWPENTLDAVHAAATRFAWRPADATVRMIVHATDDDFGEAPAVQSQQTIQHTYRETVAALRSAEVRMFSFAARVGGQCECLDVRPGLFTDYRGQPSLPDATGGGVFDIDEVAAGRLGFAAAVSGAIRSGVCTRYPLSPFADKR